MMVSACPRIHTSARLHMLDCVETGRIRQWHAKRHRVGKRSGSRGRGGSVGREARKNRNQSMMSAILIIAQSYIDLVA